MNAHHFRDGGSQGDPSRRERQARLAQQSRQQYDELLTQIHRFEAALADAAPGRQRRWAEQISQTLDAVIHSLEMHITSTEAKDGLFPEIEAAAPSMASRLEELRREHLELNQQAQGLRYRVDPGEDDNVDFHEVRHEAAQLLTATRRHQAIENDLIFEAFFFTDSRGG